MLYLKGPLLLQISGSHIVAAISAICMTAMAIIGLSYRASGKKPLPVAWDSLGILAIYGVATYILYASR
jgi:cation:H+ antiporter